MKRAVLMAVAVAMVGTFKAAAADEGGAQAPGGGGQGTGTQQRGLGGENGKRRPPPPIIAVLDANKDGVIDAAEITHAPAALKKLDKNGDGKLTREELMPPRPPRPDGEQGGPGGGEDRQDRGGHSGPPPQDGPENQ